jgi:hypothetical protein
MAHPCSRKRVIHLAVSRQPGVGSDRGTAKLQQQTTVEIERQSAPIRFTVASTIATPFDPPQTTEF